MFHIIYVFLKASASLWMRLFLTYGWWSICFMFCDDPQRILRYACNIWNVYDLVSHRVLNVFTRLTHHPLSSGPYLNVALILRCF